MSEKKPRVKWTYETCMEESKKYKSRGEFKNNCISAYEKALKTGWLEAYDWLKRPEPHKKWTYETCKEESKKYASRGDFDRGCRGAYSVAFKNGWIDDFVWLIRKKNPDGYWSYDTCKEEAKKYTSRGDFAKNSRVAYRVARKNGWLEEYDWFKVLWKRKWNYDSCLEESKKFKSRAEFIKGNASAYNVARINKWIDDYDWLEPFKRKPKWNINTCREEAKKYKYRSEFKEGCVIAYNIARKNGWIEDYDWLEPSKTEKKWNYNTCMEEAKKYKTRTEFYKGCHGAYNVAKINGWIEEYDWFVQKQKPSGYWTYETCKEESKKYKSISEFQKTSSRAYELARRNGWLKEYEWLEQKQKSNGYWNYETCIEEAKKYKTISEFRKNNGSAYQLANNNGWIDDYDWLERTQKPNGYWNYDTCMEEARKYTTRKEFSKKSSGAYNVAIKNGWVDKYDWFEASKTAKKWDYEACKTEAKKFTTRHDFDKGSVTAYRVSLKNGWIDDYDWLETPKTAKKWDYESCKEEAKKYKSRGDYKRCCNGAYHIARKNGWLDEYDWFDDIDVTYKTKRGHCIYAYVWENESVAYVGLTHQKQRRHRNHTTKEDSPVFRFSRDNDLPIPNPIYIEDKLSHEEAQQKEAYYIEQYKKLGYNMLNSAPAGSLGCFGKGKWNYNACKEEAMKYSSRNEFKHGNSGAYNASRMNGWIDDYVWFEALWRKWTYETCMEESKKYKSRGEFCDCSGSAYSAALKNGWLDDYDWLEQIQKPSGYWTYETCKDVALKCTSRNEFRTLNGSAYNVAKRNGWIDEYDWLEVSKTNKKWNYETCREEAKKYMSRGAFIKGNSRAYEVARKNGWLDEYNWQEEMLRRNYWNYETCKEEAKKYKSKKDFANNCSSAYQMARKNGWLNEYVWLKRPAAHNKKWNYELCMEEARKYKTRGEFQKGSNGAYDVARVNGWLDDYDWFEQNQKPGGYWIYETCKEEALKYKSRGEFQKCCVGAYNVARKNGWLDDYDWFAISKTGKKWTYETCKEESKKYHSRVDFCKGSRRAYEVALENGWLDDYDWFEKKR